MNDIKIKLEKNIIKIYIICDYKYDVFTNNYIV